MPLFLFGCAVGYVGFREYLDEGSMGVLGHPAGVGIVMIVGIGLMVPASGALVSGVSGLMGPYVIGFLCVPFAPYFAMITGRVMSGVFTIEGSQPAEREDPFYHVERGVGIGSIVPAIEEYQRILREEFEALLPHEIIGGHMRIVELLIRKDRFEEALTWIDKAHEAARAAPLPKSEKDPPALSPADKARFELFRSEALVVLGRRDEAVDALRALLKEQQSLPNTELGRAAADLIPTVAERLKSALGGVDEDPNPIEYVDLAGEDLLIRERDDPELSIEPPADLNI